MGQSLLHGVMSTGTNRSLRPNFIFFYFCLFFNFILLGAKLWVLPETGKNKPSGHACDNITC